MNILALDTADEVFSAALSAPGGVWYSEVDAGSRHSELLMDCVNGLCESAGIVPGDINQALCMKGPGSFTGLRIGYSAAKGLCLALGIPLTAVPTLDCAAYPLSMWPGLILPVIDAKKGCFFAALYRGKSRVSDFLDISPENLARETKKIAKTPEEPIIVTGSGAEKLYPRFKALSPPGTVTVYPLARRGRARELLEICGSGIVKSGDDMNSGPEYLRKSDAELNWG